MAGAVYLAVILVVISYIDWRTMIIPDGLVLSLLVIPAVELAAGLGLPVFSRILGFGAVSVPMFLLNMVIPGSFGGGDVKLAAVGGLILGVPRIFLAGFLSILFGGSYGIYLLAAGKAGPKDQFPFGPFLSAGIFVSKILGDRILCWYAG